MATESTPAVDAASTVDMPIEDLIARAGDLKGELVAFAQSSRFARRLDGLLADAADRLGHLDEARFVLTIDRFALQHQLQDGRTVVERFVAQRRPRLSDLDREMLLGWRGVVEGCFEVGRLDGDALELHNLLDDLVYRVYSNMGRRALTALRTGMFVLGRLVPVHPSTDAFLVSGHLTSYPRSARRDVASAALEQVTAHPELLRPNPALLKKAWDAQAEHRAEFIAQVGSDFVVLTPTDAQATLREHYRRVQDKAAARLEGKVAKRAATRGPQPEDMGRLPAELLDAENIGLIYDEVEGLNIYRDLGRLDALFADPTLGGDRTYLSQLRDCLHDDSVSPLAIRYLVQRHPDGANTVFRTLLRKPGFSWSRDGESLLRRHKATYFDCEPMPSISIIGERLTELLRARR